MEGALYKAETAEESPLGKQILKQLEQNLQIAGEDRIPICQDTGMAVVFAEVGQEVHADGSKMRSMRACAKDTRKAICVNPW